MNSSHEIVIIGGGAIGCSIAYHLTRLGRRDVLLLEKHRLTHGATWHAAGLVGQLRTQRNLTRMLQYSVELYSKIEKETGQAVDWRPVGSLRLASSEERWQEIKRTATIARSFAFELHLLSATEAHQLFPLMTTDGLVGAAWIPSDGYIDPTGLTMAYAKGARAGGAEIAEGVRVTGICTNGRRVTEVITDRGNIRAEYVVNAAGMWAREIGHMVGVAVPAGAVEHQYLLTEVVPDAPKEFPTVRDPDKLFYLKPEVGAIALGGWEPDTVPFGERGIPPKFGKKLLPPNFERFEQIARLTTQRIPGFDRLGVQRLVNGAIPVSPDGEPVLGRMSGFDNFFVACGFTAGIAASGGAGRAMAEWIAHDDPGMDLWPFDIRRFGRHAAGTRYLHERAVESYGHYYSIHWPGEEMHSGRGARRSPLYGLLKEHGAVFGSRAGWERANWFAPDRTAAVEKPSFTKPNWFEHAGNEHRGTRDRVALFDLSSFSKFVVQGPGACKALQWLATNNVDRAPGWIVYTQLCNSRGGIEADLAITRLAEDRFYITTGSAVSARDWEYLSRHLPNDGSVTLTDMTAARCVIGVWGPRARELLQQVTHADLSHAAFPFLRAREIEIGYAPVLALRVSYVGELGWELHIPTEYGAHVYELLWRAGQAPGAVNAGYRALESLRLEKRFVYWGADVNSDTNPYEAGLGFCVALDKGDFVGREALVRIKTSGPRQKLVTFTLEANRAVFGGEAILHAGKTIGVTTSAGYGYTIGKYIALGYLPAELGNEHDFEIEAFCERIPARCYHRCLYDPNGERLRG